MWVFILMNMIYADILNWLKPTSLEELEYAMNNFSGETVLLFAIFMEIPIVMIVFSRLLNRKGNRIANFIAAPICILWVIVPSFAMGKGNTPLSYLFFATVESLTMIFIMWYCWKWNKD